MPYLLLTFLHVNLTLVFLLLEVKIFKARFQLTFGFLFSMVGSVPIGDYLVDISLNFVYMYMSFKSSFVALHASSIMDSFLFIEVNGGLWVSRE